MIYVVLVAMLTGFHDPLGQGMSGFDYWRKGFVCCGSYKVSTFEQGIAAVFIIALGHFVISLFVPTKKPSE